MIERVAGDEYCGDESAGVWLRMRPGYLCEYGTNWYCVPPEEPPRELAVANGGGGTKPFDDEVVGAGLM